MNDKNEKARYESRFGCGCFSVLLEIVAFVVICNICGCQWADRATRSVIRYIADAASVGGGNAR